MLSYVNVHDSIVHQGSRLGSIDGVYDVEGLQQVNGDAVLPGKIFVYVLSGSFNIDSGDGLQDLFASMQDARDTGNLGSVNSSPYIGIVKVIC